MSSPPADAARVARVGVTHHVQPVTPPALAVTWRREQAIDDPGERPWRLVGEEVANRVGRRRQAGEVEGGASDQRPLVGRRGWFQPFRFQAGEDEAVEVARRPRRVLHGRRLGVADRLERPELALLVCDRVLRGDWRFHGHGGVDGPGGALLDPARESLDLGVGQLALRRHLGLALIADGADERALVGLARHDRGAVVAPFENRRARGQAQAPLGLLVAVALLAAGDQHGADPLLEVVGRVVREGAGLGRGPDGENPEDGERPSHGSGLPGADRRAGSRRVVGVLLNMTVATGKRKHGRTSTRADRPRRALRRATSFARMVGRPPRSRASRPWVARRGDREDRR